MPIRNVTTPFEIIAADGAKTTFGEGLQSFTAKQLSHYKTQANTEEPDEKIREVLAENADLKAQIAALQTPAPTAVKVPAPTPPITPVAPPAPPVATPPAT